MERFGYSCESAVLVKIQDIFSEVDVRQKDEFYICRKIKVGELGHSLKKIVRYSLQYAFVCLLLSNPWSLVAVLRFEYEIAESTLGAPER